MWEVSEYLGMAVEVVANEEILEEDKKMEQNIRIVLQANI